MKADSCGTITEQVRHRQGWYPANQRPRCENCEHVALKKTESGVTAKCVLGNFSTSPSACCNAYKKK